MTFQDAPDEGARCGRVAGAEVFVRLGVAAEARGEEAG